MTSSSLPLIDVDRLQLGMYVVLDVGWRNHPFLRSSFTVQNAEQLQQIRELGLRQVHYDPSRSVSLAAAAEAAVPPRLATATATATPSIVHVRSFAELEPPTDLQWQDESLRRVEAEYGAVLADFRTLLAQAAREPAQARDCAERIRDTLCDTVLEADIPAVRMLSQRVPAAASGSHEVAVAALASLLARDVGLEPDTIRRIALAALLHDLGKTRIPTFLHEDDGRLTEFERNSYRQHVHYGLALLKPMDIEESVLRAVAEHHERMDGSGFPVGLAGAAISEAGRILSISNRYMNLVCPLHGDAGLTPHQALQQMYSRERAHFDPVYLPRFVRMMGIYPPGSLVELSDQRMAIVVATRPGASLYPRVQVLERPDAAATETLDIEPDGDLRVRRSLPPDQLNPVWAQRARQCARTPIYIEPQSAPEWGPWSALEQPPAAY